MALIAVMFIPLFVIVLNLKEAKIAGAIEVKFEEIREAQAAQSSQLEAVQQIASGLMKTVVLNMLKDDDIQALVSLKDKQPLSAKGGDDTSGTNEIVDRLKRAGLVTFRQAVAGSDTGHDDLSLTDIGKLFLDNYKKAEEKGKE